MSQQHVLLDLFDVLIEQIEDTRFRVGSELVDVTLGELCGAGMRVGSGPISRLPGPGVNRLRLRRVQRLGSARAGFRGG